MSADERIRARLRLLVDEHSQSGLARATGVPQPSISRYLSGRRIPAGFCTALVDALGVNPAWLLAGEGARYLADVPPETAGAARELLELVSAMRAVARMKLGALMGRDHARALRELHDHLTAYEGLRARLAKRTRPVLRRLLDDLEAAARAHDRERAAWLAKAAGQARRLCDDDELGQRHDELEAWRLYMDGEVEAALARQRKLVFRHIATGAAGELEVDRMRNYVVALGAVGRMHEARRVATALREMHRTDPPGTAFYAFSFLAGRLDAELGALWDGIEAMQRSLPHLGRWGQRNRALLDEGLLLAGVLSGAEALAKARAGWAGLELQERTVVAPILTVHALWSEDERLLARTRALVDDVLAGLEEPRFRFLRRHAAALEEALAKGRKPAYRSFARDPLVVGTRASGAADDRFVRALALCQVARCAGARDEALRELEAAERARVESGSVRVRSLSLHFRNALELLGPRTRAHARRELRARAARFFAERAARGYALFEETAADAT